MNVCVFKKQIVATFWKICCCFLNSRQIVGHFDCVKVANWPNYTKNTSLYLKKSYSLLKIQPISLFIE
jgi:hypothetical protein